MSKPNSIWIIGRKVTLAANGYSHIAEPFIAFPSAAEADEACDLVERVSGERPMKAEASFSPRRASPQNMGVKGGEARAAKLSPERRSEIARTAANSRWKAPTP